MKNICENNFRFFWMKTIGPGRPRGSGWEFGQEVPSSFNSSFYPGGLVFVKFNWSCELHRCWWRTLASFCVRVCVFDQYEVSVTSRRSLSFDKLHDLVINISVTIICTIIHPIDIIKMHSRSYFAPVVFDWIIRWNLTNQR